MKHTPTTQRKQPVKHQTKLAPVSQPSQLKQAPANTPTVSPQAHPRHLNWLERYVPWVLIVAGSLGLFASLMLSVEEIHHLKHPAARLGCDLNPIIGCGSILDTWQGHVLFGVPNQFWSVAMFAAVITIGFAILAGAKLKRWFWVGLQAGMFLGFGFVVWFMAQSLFVLKHLCPYCMLTWIAVIPVFWYTTLYCIRAEHLRLHGRLSRLNHFAQKHHADILFALYLTVAGLILWRFWYYWQTLL
jgi:uncharacterized membrane protein